MDLSKLKPAEGSTKNRKRIGRGQGSGRGGTSTRGHKGAQSRSGYKRKAGFEGGQMPLQRRVPKRGFKNINRVEYTPFNLSKLEQIAQKFNLKEINIVFLQEHRLISRTEKVKVLGHGELKSKLDVHVHAISESAKKAIEDLGGSVTLVQ
ncbi:MAG: 50S ribosomal protein L15 [Chitinophagales bacterium]|nr:50S ribosomal protein L15 [Chitinophagales bacterium]